MEPYEKIYVGKKFLETEHGRIPCQKCHGGNPADADWQTAHDGIVADPTMTDAPGVCGECHPDIVESAAQSLHFTLAPMKDVIRLRAGGDEQPHWPQVDQAFERHCGQCHTSCGQCHVSRPDYVLGGLLSAHSFHKRPQMDVTCASCHGGRVYAEYVGNNKGRDMDYHYDVQEMECLDCHTGEEMHAAAGEGESSRQPPRPRCEDCHPEVSGAEAGEAHRNHQGRVACQVCHSQAYKNCYECHVGTDQHGLPYYKCGEAVFNFKIGRNPEPTEQRPESWVLLRHPPTNPGLFDFYLTNALPDFDQAPTWKPTRPHNILKTTEQNKECNNCHGRRELFLTESDLAEGELEANRDVLVMENQIPQPIEVSGGD